MDKLSEKEDGTRQNGHKSARNTKEKAELKERVLTLR